MTAKVLAFALAAALLSSPSAGGATTLGIQGSRFAINGRPTFLTGISYYGALGASPTTWRRDLDAIRRHGLNWLRVWATWSYGGDNVAAVDGDGRPREPYFGRLRDFVRECDRRGIIVDVTLSRGDPGSGMIAGDEAHRVAVQTICAALARYRNWYLDLANERDIGDARHVSIAEVRELRALARRFAPRLVVTASFGGHDLDEADVRAAVETAGLDFLAPHRPRHPVSPLETEQRTRDLTALTKRLGLVVPVHYQEPFRRGYGDWQPRAEDFAADLAGAIEGGAAGWCFHNGDTREAGDGRPRRSFDLRESGLFEQLDAEERRFLTDFLPGLRRRAERGVAQPPRRPE
jgi:hypothetical protein